MIRSIRLAVAGALVSIACVVALSACGSSSPGTKTTATTSPPPGLGDASICQLTTKATTAYGAKDYITWKTDMGQIAGLADSAQYTPLKKYAEQVKKAVDAATTSTTSQKDSKKKKAAGLNLNGSLLSADMSVLRMSVRTCHRRNGRNRGPE